MSEDQDLTIWTVYHDPVDFEGWIARRFVVSGGPEPVATGDIVTGSLDHLRDRFASQGLFCIPRSPEDEPQVIESWL